MKPAHLTGRARRQAKIRFTIKGTAEKPRVSVFRSNTQVVCQLIDDTKGVTIAAASGVELKDVKGTKTERAAAVGALLGDRALEKKVKKVVFDRGGYRYHGRVKAVAEALRQKGLEF